MGSFNLGSDDDFCRPITANSGALKLEVDRAVKLWRVVQGFLCTGRVRVRRLRERVLACSDS